MTAGEAARAGTAARLGRWAQVGLLLFGVYHLVRDVSTAFFDVGGAAVDVGHRPHAWCGGVCDVVTIPLELFNIVAAAVVLRRGRPGWLAAVNLLTIPLWLAAWLAP
ncbi:MAG TPA: hypothetical protein VFT95_05470 [Micromonosporaceae bacterium]|nr:hypothetical protein [Micromonosporaceae bacterium]